MAIQLSPSFAPADLFERLEAEPGDGEWSVIRTRSRMEKSLARAIYSDGFGFFLPLYEERKVYQRRTVTVQLPLFSGYLFAYGDNDSRSRIVRRREVAGILLVEDQAQLRAELCAIHRLINSGEPVTREDRLEAGMPAMLTSVLSPAT